jgi:hypothetical protein
VPDLAGLRPSGESVSAHGILKGEEPSRHSTCHPECARRRRNRANAGSSLAATFALGGGWGFGIFATGVTHGAADPLLDAGSGRRRGRCHRQPRVQRVDRPIHVLVEDAEGVGPHLPAAHFGPARRNQPHGLRQAGEVSLGAAAPRVRPKLRIAA